MKYLKNFENVTNVDDIEISEGSYWIIYGSAYYIILVLEKFKKYLPSNDHEIDMNRMINNLYKYKDEKIIGIYLYFSVYGFSTSILSNEKNKQQVYNSQQYAKIYDFKGELKLTNYELFLDDSEKMMFDDIKKFNI